MPQTQQYLSTDPLAGDTAEQPKYLSVDPSEGEIGPDFRTSNEVGPDGRNVVVGDTERPPQTLGRFAGAAWDAINPIEAAKGFGRMVIPEAAARAMGAGDEEASQYGPMNTIAKPMAATFEAAREAYARGDYGNAAIKALFSAVPMLGPALSQMGDEMGSDPVKALGTATGVGLGMAGPAVAPGAIRARVGGPLRPTVNPAEAAAVQFGREQAIPLDAGTVTGSQFVKNVQKKAGGSWGGANTVETVQRAQGDALAATGGKLAERAYPKAVGAVEAGEAVQGALKGKIQELHKVADTAYQKLRDIENAKPQRPPRSQSLQALDVSQRTPLAVDITAAVEQLQPLYKQLKRESELGIPMHGAKGRTLAALDGLMNSPNWAPLSVVDAALSDLKAMARGADMPELRTSGQATAAQAVRALDAQVRATASKAGPEVLKALEDGRAAITSKYATSEAMDLIAPMGGEPRGVFSRLTANKDAGLLKLRELQKHAPKEVPKLARAILEEILDKPTSEGGFKFADKAAADWQKLGAGTKKMLFPKAGHVRALDNFFLLAKKIGENPNPSGTAQTLNATNIVAGIPMYALAKLLYTPKGVSALTRAVEISVSPKPAAQAAALAQLTRAGQEAGVILPFPKAAENQEPKQ